MTFDKSGQDTSLNVREGVPIPPLPLVIVAMKIKIYLILSYLQKLLPTFDQTKTKLMF